MQITLEQFLAAAEKWVQQDLVSKGTPMQKAFATFAFLQMKPRISQAANSLKVFADEHGNFESEELHKNMAAALDSAGGAVTIPLLNYTFDKADLTAVFNYL